VTATELRRFLDDNQVHLASLINNLVTTGDIVVKHLPGLRQVLVSTPTSSRAASRSSRGRPRTGLYDAHFGMVLTNDPPVCHNGYQSTDTRPPQGRLEPGDERQRPLYRARLAVQPAAARSTRPATDPRRSTASPWRGTTRGVGT
jgi:phospholipid/cholesterol/gamma-HCH transport system substrate-binding protein